MPEPMPQESGGSLVSPERALLVAVVLASAGAIGAVLLVVARGLQGGSPGDAIPIAIGILVVALVLAGAVLAYGKRVQRRQRPAWMAQTTEWRQEIVERQEEYHRTHTPAEGVPKADI